MRITSFVTAVTAAICLSLTLPAAAKQNLGAHVHGAGEVNLAQDGKQLYIELTLPAHDALGFETIKTDSQKQELALALKKLEAPDMWVLPTKAQCQLEEAHASANRENHGDKHHDDHDDDHARHHHDHDPDHEHKDSNHLDIQATYLFSCSAPNNLNSIGTDLFKRFERSERLSLKGLTNAGSISATLTPAQPEAKF